MVWDGARDGWFLQGHRLIRKPRSLRLTPKTDAANTPPYLPRSAVPTPLPPGQAAIGRPRPPTSNSALIATLAGSIITATFGGAGEIIPTTLRTPLGNRTADPRVPQVATAQNSVLRYGAVVDTPPPGVQQVSQPRSFVPPQQRAPAQYFLGLFVQQPPPSVFVGPTLLRTPAIQVQSQNYFPGQLHDIPPARFSGSAQLARAPALQVQSQSYFPGFFTEEQPPPSVFVGPTLLRALAIQVQPQNYFPGFFVEEGVQPPVPPPEAGSDARTLGYPNIRFKGARKKQEAEADVEPLPAHVEPAPTPAIERGSGLVERVLEENLAPPVPPSLPPTPDAVPRVAPASIAARAPSVAPTPAPAALTPPAPPVPPAPPAPTTPTDSTSVDIAKLLARIDALVQQNNRMKSTATAVREAHRTQLANLRADHQNAMEDQAQQHLQALMALDRELQQLQNLNRALLAQQLLG